MWTEWNVIVADNVAQAADAATRSLERGVFAGMRALDLAGYRWALPCISSYFLISLFTGIKQSVAKKGRENLIYLTTLCPQNA